MILGSHLSRVSPSRYHTPPHYDLDSFINGNISAMLDALSAHYQAESLK